MKLEDDAYSSSQTGGVQSPPQASTSGNREMSTTSAAKVDEVEVKEEPELTVDLTESSLFDNHVIYS